MMITGFLALSSSCLLLNMSSALAQCPGGPFEFVLQDEWICSYACRTCAGSSLLQQQEVRSQTCMRSLPRMRSACRPRQKCAAKLKVLL